jgi:hypothetical protein
MKYDPFPWDDTDAIDAFMLEFDESDFGQRLAAEESAERLHKNYRAMILVEAAARYGHDDVTIETYILTAKSMWKAGDLAPEPVVIKPVEKKLSPSQERWREYRIYTDGNRAAGIEPHSVQQCKDRAKVDSGYASFLHKNLEREAQNTPHVTFEHAGTEKVDQGYNDSPELRQFAIEYRKLTADQARKYALAAFNPDWKIFKKNLDDCCACGLL